MSLSQSPKFFNTLKGNANKGITPNQAPLGLIYLYEGIKLLARASLAACAPNQAMLAVIYLYKMHEKIVRLS